MPERIYFKFSGSLPYTMCVMFILSEADLKLLLVLHIYLKVQGYLRDILRKFVQSRSRNSGRSVESG